MAGLGSLDSLLDDAEPYATFHDAELLSVFVDYAAAELVAVWLICVGNPDAGDGASRERRRQGRLTLSGLTFWVVEPPQDVSAGLGNPWLAGDGPLDQADTAVGRRLAASLPKGRRPIPGWVRRPDPTAAAGFAYDLRSAAAFPASGPVNSRPAR